MFTHIFAVLNFQRMDDIDVMRFGKIYIVLFCLSLISTSTILLFLKLDYKAYVYGLNRSRCICRYLLLNSLLAFGCES